MNGKKRNPTRTPPCQTAAKTAAVHTNQHNEPPDSAETLFRTALELIRAELSDDPGPVFWRKLQERVREEVKPAQEGLWQRLGHWLKIRPTIALTSWRLVPAALLLAGILLFAGHEQPARFSGEDFYLLSGGLPGDRFTRLVLDERDDSSEELSPTATAGPADPWNRLLEELIPG